MEGLVVKVLACHLPCCPNKGLPFSFPNHHLLNYWLLLWQSLPEFVQQLAKAVLRICPAHQGFPGTEQLAPSPHWAHLFISWVSGCDTWLHNSFIEAAPRIQGKVYHCISGSLSLYFTCSNSSDQERHLTIADPQKGPKKHQVSWLYCMSCHSWRSGLTENGTGNFKLHQIEVESHERPASHIGWMYFSIGYGRESRGYSAANTLFPGTGSGIKEVMGLQFLAWYLCLSCFDRPSYAYSSARPKVNIQ